MSESDQDQLARVALWVMQNSVPAGEIAGVKLRVCERLPSGLAVFCCPERPEEAAFIRFVSEEVAS